MIRPAGRGDIGFLVDVGRAFHVTCGHVAPFVDEHLARTLSEMINSGNGILYRGEAGAIVGLIYPLFYNNDWVQAQELYWWGDGEGQDLLDAFEQDAITRGANEIVMGSLEAQRPEAVSRLLRRRGYRAKENLYSRVI